MSSLAIFLADGFEEIEGLTVVDVCRRADLDITMVSVGQSLTVTGSHGIAVTADKKLDEVDFDAMEMLVLPGGKKGTENLEKCGFLMEKLDEFYGKGRYVAAICAAPSILAHRGMLNGRRACCYPTFEEHLKDAQIVREPAVTSGNVITGRGMGCSIPFALAVVAALSGPDKADAIARQIVYA